MFLENDHDMSPVDAIVGWDFWMNAPTAGWANHWVNLSLEVTNAMHPPIRLSLELATISQGTSIAG